MIDIKVPEFGESIQEVQIGQWLKREGEFIAKDADLVELESEKASQALPSPESGIITEILFKDGAFVPVGETIARMEPADSPPESGGKSGKGSRDRSQQQAAADRQPAEKSTARGKTREKSEPATAAPKKSARPKRTDLADESRDDGDPVVMPAAERLLREHHLSPRDVMATGPGGRLLKEDVLRHLEESGDEEDEDRSQRDDARAESRTDPPPRKSGRSAPERPGAPIMETEPAAGGNRSEERRPMSMIRRTIASRLVEAQRSAALLTTFNEIDMEPVMELRSRYKEAFEEKHGVKLGFMSFFAKASVEALKRFPAVNARIEGNDVIYHNYCDIGIAIGSGKGLVVPVLRNVEQMSFARIERQIGEFANQVQENRIRPDDLEGGTFTISNGGVYGSLLSTPIVNPPQSGILGLHAIQKRPVAVDDQVVIRPMMYVALTYDHRIVDGREAVQFLKTIKDVLEEPARLFLEV